MAPEPVQCHKCHTGHAKWRSMSPSATPASQSDGRCRQVPPLPRKQRPRPRHQMGTKRATRASPVPTVPRLRRKQRPCPRHQTGTKRATRASPVPSVPRLPRKVTVDVAKCHPCHANSGRAHGTKREPSAPPEPAQCHQCHACHAK